MRKYLKRATPEQVRRKSRDSLVAKTPREGKEVLWERVVNFDLGSFGIIEVRSIGSDTVLLVCTSSQHGQFVLYDHRDEIISKAGRYLKGSLRLQVLENRIATECRIELVKKTEGQGSAHYCNLFRRPAKYKVSGSLNLDDVAKMCS